MVDNSENILVEFDYQNISLIDPNKIVDLDGNVQDRLIQQENLVMYANLECSVLPRTKLAVGVPQTEAIRTVSVGKINFLNPGFREFLDNAWSDEITGKDTLQGKGVNQPAINITKNPDLSDDYYYSQIIKSNGDPGAVDNGLLGIVDINVNIGTDFLPVIEITLEDVKGRALFEAGNNSPYAAFFNLPYPLFYLTLKGYLGKAIRIPLMLQSFNASFDPSTHNFRVRCEFYTYKYTLMADITWAQMMAVPSMYRVKVDKQIINSDNPANTKTTLEQTHSSGGLQKMKEIYSEYKSKGLIADDFPEITILELKTRLEKLITNIEEQFKKTNLDKINKLESYTDTIAEYTKKVYYELQTSWAREFCDQELVFIQNNTNETIFYQFRKDLINDSENQEKALQNLESKITKYNTQLTSNPVVGKDIPVAITPGIFFKPVTINDINIEKTYKKRNGVPLQTNEYEKFRNQIANEIINGVSLGKYKGLIVFDGVNSFLDVIKNIEEKFVTKKQEVEESLTKEIQAQFENKTNGLGFQPTIRNVMAVFFAQGEAFLRLLDDVHTKAWDLRDDPNRRKAVLNTSSVDNKNNEINTPIYPWPQVIGEVLEDGKEKYVLKYPGDSDIATKINAYFPEIWPEVQFVEEFLRGFTERESPSISAGDTGNFLDKPDRFSFNAIEFTIGNDVYQNTEEVKFFYEIYERMLLNSFYTKMNRNSVKQYNINSFVSESESSDIVKALGNDNPFLIKKLKEYDINAQNYQTFLKQISNQGEGPSYQNFIRKEYNTSYIKNDVNVPFFLYKGSILQSNAALPSIGLTKNDESVAYFEKNIVDEFDFTDLYPLTNLTWCKDNLVNGVAIQSEGDTFKTSDTLEYNTSIKLIKNKTLSPVTNFNYKQDVFNQTLNLTNLNTFYTTRQIKDQFATEGNVTYEGYDGGLTPNQTTSIFNTPIFSNAIQLGVKNATYDQNDLSPFKTAAYLFLNSLPLATLRDKYKLYNSDGSVSTKGYILPSLLKFGAVHELPYAWVLKYGSIWYRYKNWIENGVDILTDVWKDTDYIYNYDPFYSASTTQYQVNVDGQNYDIFLDETATIGTNYKDIINTGFYPKLINDYNTFFQGSKVFSELNDITGTYYVSGDTLEVLSVNFIALEPGETLSGSSLDLGTKIVSQISGVPGSTGFYKISPSQTTNILTGQTPGNFIVTNKKVGVFSNQNIQNAINTNFKMLISPPTVINAPFGYDITNPTTAINVTPWNCYVLSQDNQSIYLMPSLGSNVNQTSSECFSLTNTKILSVPNNPAVHNGSVRLFWQAPNYGYFDVSKLIKPNPDQYIRDVFSDSETQQNFGLFGTNEYTNISELFTTFSKDILDKFEEQFLLFSSNASNFESNLSPKNPDENTELTYENFQGLMREMFKIEKVDGLTGTALIDKLKDNQKTKIQNTLDLFMGYSVVFKNGNPSNFDRRTFYSFSNLPVIDKYTWEGYQQKTPNALPTNGGSVTLIQSKTAYPDQWKALETYVGFSDITGLVYTNNGSYITDFFVDFNIEFSVNNIKNLSPIIKIYAKEKLKDSTMNQSKFLDLMTTYLNNGETYLNIILDSTLTTTRAKLPNITITAESEGVKFKEYNGDVTRYEMWDSFKSINDKWISGADLKSRTLFEDILILDRASRDVGNRIFVDIFKVQNMISSMNYNNRMLGVIEQIFVDNRFKSFIMPAYANFYNVQDASKTPTPKPEGTTEFANSLFGTFLNVDYRDTRTKYVSIYAYAPSQHLAMNENVDYRYRDDAFDLRRATENPLLENQTDKTNWDKSNKVVGFTVDFGPQNQQVFKQLDIAQDPGLPTAESEQLLTQMANQYRNRGGATQSVSLYNVYRNRSYRCSIDMMGNALIQPMMYFHLRNVPLFSGPYMITSVKHRISRNGFDTYIEGQRQPFYSIPAVETLLQSLTTQILTTLKERVEEKEKVINDTNTILALKSDVINKINTTQAVLTANQACQEKLNTSFTQYTNQTPQETTITFDKATQIIATRINQTTSMSVTNKGKLLDFIMSTMYIETGKGQKFVSYDNNYAAVRLDINPYGGAANTYFKPNYYCVSRGSIINVPYVSFSSFENFVDFFIAKYKDKAPDIRENPSDKNIVIDSISRAYVTTWPSNIETTIYTDLSDDDKEKIKNKVKYVIDYLRSVGYQ